MEKLGGKLGEKLREQLREKFGIVGGQVKEQLGRS